MAMQLQVGVKCFLRNPHGQYLLLQRNKTAYPEIEDLWDIPGGRIVPGATLEANLQREIFEETGLTLIATPHIVAAQDIMRNSETHVVRLTYVADIDGEPSLDGMEHTLYQWVSYDGLPGFSGIDCYTREIIDQGLL
jgi:8-oxo-dGTP pyrophosphatase MutT (NUDIX family)